MSMVRFNPPLVNNNPDAPRERKRTAKPTTPAGTRELVNPTLQDFPSPNSPLFNQGLVAIRKTLGKNAFLVMSELGTHKLWFQLTQARVAELTELSRAACDRAIQLLVKHDYIERVECRKAGRRFGNVLHSCLAGNIQKLDGYVTHFSVEANTKEAATRHARRKTVRASHNPSNPDRPRTGSKRKRKAVGNESATPAATFLHPAALPPSGEGTPGPDPLYPYNGNMTEEEENQYLLTSFSGEKEELNHFFIPEGSQVGISTVEVEAQEVVPSPGAFGAPDGSEEPDSLLGAIVPVERTIAEAEQGVAFALCPLKHPELRSRWNNSTARALIAPDWEASVHAGYDLFSRLAPEAFETPLQDGCMKSLDYGFGAISRSELNGDGAKLWIATHKFGILILQCFKNFDEVTNIEAFQIVKKLRNGQMSQEYVFRTWTEVDRGIRRPFINGHEFYRAWIDHNTKTPDGRDEHDAHMLLDVLHGADMCNLFLEESSAENDAEEMLKKLRGEGLAVYNWVKELHSYGVSLYIKLDMCRAHCSTKLQAMVALWLHSVQIGDAALLGLLRNDASLGGLRGQLLRSHDGRKMVRGIHHMQKKGVVSLNLAIEAGWHSFEEFDVLAKFNAVASAEAMRVLSHNG